LADMKALFIGGTGIISTACTALAATEEIDLYLLNRGMTVRRPLPPNVHVIQADARDKEQLAKALEGHTFDCVVDWIAFTPDHVKMDVEFFRERTRQFIFISSAVVYQKPPAPFVVTESTPLGNTHPQFHYALNKIASEQVLMEANRESNFPAVIVRPSHTYDTNVPAIAIGGRDYSLIDRMKQGKPVILHGDGNTLWTLTHSEDFAKAFVGLMGNEGANGQAFHITSDEVLTWNQIYETIGRAAGVAPNIVHVPSDFIARINKNTGAGLLGDKAYCAVFDNSKIKKFVPGFEATISFAQGVRRTLEWFDEDPARRTVSEDGSRLTDSILSAYGKALDACPAV
jgi:nucleoside-diphosphate-sugar epimerase